MLHRYNDWDNMRGSFISLPDKGLQSLLLRQVVLELPRFIESPLWPLPSDDALECLDAAVMLFCEGKRPALSPAKVFSSLRLSELPAFDLTSSSALLSLPPRQVSAMMAEYLIAHSEKCCFERFCLRTSHIATPRAMGLFLRLLRSVGGQKSLVDFTLRGDAGFSGEVARRNMKDVATAVGALPLRALNLPGVAAVDDEILELMLRGSNGNVDTLDIAMCSVTSAGIASLLVNDKLCLRRGLRDLDMSGTSIDSSSVLALTGMDQLERLSLAWTQVVRPSGRSSRDQSDVDLAEAGLLLGTVLASLPRLRMLDLSGATIDLGGSVLSEVEGVRELILASSRVDDRTGRMTFAERLPAAVQVLDLSGVSGSASVLRMLQAVGERVGGTLESINLANCELRGWDLHAADDEIHADEAFDTVFDGVAELNLVQLFNSSLYALRSLDLSHTGGITERTLVLMFVGEGFLHRVVNLSMRGLKLPKFALRLKQWAHVGVEYSLPALESLDLSDSTLADAPSALAWFVGALLADASEFQSLNLGGARSLTYDVVGEALALTSSTLSTLNMQFCPYPSTAPGHNGHDVLGHLSARAFPSLRSVNLRGCGPLPRSMIMLLTRQADNLDEVVADDGAFLADEVIGLAEKRRAFGLALVNAAEKERQDALAQSPWRVRN